MYDKKLTETPPIYKWLLINHGNTYAFIADEQSTYMKSCDTAYNTGYIKASSSKGICKFLAQYYSYSDDQTSINVDVSYTPIDDVFAFEVVRTFDCNQQDKNV